MPSSTPASLSFTADQKDILTKVGIDPTKLSLVNNHQIDPALPVDGYSSGHYLLFVEGTQEHHVAFFKKMYTTQTTPELAIKVPGLWVYETASAKFNTDENKVSVAI